MTLAVGFIKPTADGFILKIVRTFIGKIIPNHYWGFTTGFQIFQCGNSIHDSGQGVEELSLEQIYLSGQREGPWASAQS